MNRKIALVPVDARPVTRELPRQIAAIGGWQVLVPEKNELGFLKQPGNVDGLANWLKSVGPIVDGFVISTDMLGYGGLVPSRINQDREEVILSRIAILREIKRQYPEKKIMAFSATMRISNNYVNEEEKEYWKDYGEEIWSYSFHSHKFEKTGDAASAIVIAKMEAKIPADIMADYLETRKKNFNINKALLGYVEEGIIDVLVYPQDDTSEYGFNIREQELLSAEIHNRSLFSRVYIYPGADEVANTLVSRLIYASEKVLPPRFFPLYSGEKGALSSAMYEDRPIVESVKGQIFAFGSHTVNSAEEADVLLAVNVPGKMQGDLALQKNLEGVHTADRNIGEWLERIKYYICKEKEVAIADVAYANGADAAMMPSLLNSIDIHNLSGFAAWNTAGNTIGTVVAQCGMVHLQKMKRTLPKEKVRELIFDQIVLRLLDDYIYQSIVRQRVRNSLEESAIKTEELLKEVTETFSKEAKPFLESLNLKCQIKTYLPWRRTFEIGLEIKKVPGTTRILSKGVD